MKNILLVFITLLPLGLLAQQQSSKSKSKDKLYEKGDMVTLKNAAGTRSSDT